MADVQGPIHPQPPEGFQRPGIPGAGNLLDPAVRGEVREQLHPLVHDTGRQLQETQAQAAGQPPQPPPIPPAAQGGQYRAGRFPHGDVDLSDHPANVPPEPVTPNRGRAARRFYFLKETAASQVDSSTAAKPPVAGPKPG
jgi:hypothetical protein